MFLNESGFLDNLLSPFSPVQSARKFSEVIGVMVLKSSITTSSSNFTPSMLIRSQTCAFSGTFETDGFSNAGREGVIGIRTGAGVLRTGAGVGIIGTVSTVGVKGIIGGKRDVFVLVEGKGLKKLGLTS